VELLPNSDTAITIFICTVIRPVVELSKVEDICDEYEKMHNIKTSCCLVLPNHVGKKGVQKKTQVYVLF
jgi:hypothetical protein